MTTSPIERPIVNLAQRLQIHADRRRQMTELIAEVRAGVEGAAVRDPIAPFEALVSSVTATPPESAPWPVVQPPPSRFMVRVAPTGRPHRPTRRNYNYFDELNAALAATDGERSSS
jgi:hypothetical protein